MKVIVTADIEVHTKDGDVSTHEISNIFYSDDSIERISNWIEQQTVKTVLWVNDSLGYLSMRGDDPVCGTYALNKNVTIKPVEE